MPRRNVRFADYEVNFVRRELRKCGIRVRLQRKPFRVLELLLRRPGEVVTREELVSFLWPDSHVSFAHSLNTAVNSLRQALGESSECRFVETRPGLGYRFTAPVEEISDLNSDAVPSRAQGRNVEAYEDCLKGRYFLDRMAQEEIYKAIACFKSAAAEETCSSLAYAGIADAYAQLVSLGSVSSSTVASHARSSAELALRNDPDLPHAHVAAGRVKMLFDWDWKGAQEEVNRALELDSDLVSAHTLHSSLLCTLGMYEEALEACRQALMLDPLSFPANLQFAACLYGARDFKSAIDQCWKMLNLTPCFAPAQILLALSYEQLGMYEEAVIEFQNAKCGTGFQPAAISGLGHLFAVSGRQSAAEAAYAELSNEARRRYVSSYWYAVICAGRRQESLALSFLEESLRVHDPAFLWLKADARFETMREDERFLRMVCRLALTTSPRYATT